MREGQAHVQPMLPGHKLNQSPMTRIASTWRSASRTTACTRNTDKKTNDNSKSWSQVAQEKARTASLTTKTDANQARRTCKSVYSGQHIPHNNNDTILTRSLLKRWQERERRPRNDSVLCQPSAVSRQ